MARDGYYFFLPLAVLTIVLAWFQLAILAVLSLVLTVFVAYFFRDPERSIPQNPDAIVSPADGRIIRIIPMEAVTQVSIFLSVLDVHVNRAPVDGILTRKEHRPGSFHLAWDDRASLENERAILTVSGDRSLTFILVAGVLARRIRVWREEGEAVTKGDRIGLIRFGSRVDVLVPRGCKLLVSKGDRVYGGNSILALWNLTSR